MTEAEAKARWCPFARDSETAGNRSAQLPDDIRFPCIASACMAWRGRAVPMSENYGWDQNGKPVVIIDGHCGLAGAPQ